MLRSEIQKDLKLTRKAIEYYEEKGLINPKKSENGYRDYSKEDYNTLLKISLYRKIGLSLSEIKSCLFSESNILSSILRKKQYQLDIEERKKSILELIVKGTDYNIVIEKLNSIENEENIYNRLERAFPGYFGQMIFSAYKPFLNEPLEKESEDAYNEFVDYVDNLPIFELSIQEMEYIETVSCKIGMEELKNINDEKIKVIENYENWFVENKDFIEKYEEFKNSKEYLESPMKNIQEKLKKYMLDNNYYGIAIPLIRKFSKSYDNYYIKLLKANEKYIETIH